MPDGVYGKNPQRLIYENPESFCAYRLKELAPEETIVEITREARALIGSLYSVKEAALTPIYSKHNSPRAKTRSQYCSRLVSQCYAKFGVNLTTNPDYCSPNDLANSELLEPVQNYCRVSDNEHLELIKAEDLGIPLQRMTFRWLKQARKIAMSQRGFEIQNLNDVTEFVITNKEYDKEILSIAKDSGYFEYYTTDRSHNPFRYDYNLLLEKFISENLTLDHLYFEANAAKVYREAQEYNLKISQENYNNFKLKYIFEHVQLYQNILKETYIQEASISRAIEIIKTYSIS